MYRTITASAVLAAACSSAIAGLEITSLGKSYTRNAAITPANLYFSATDTGGSTSVRNVDEANLEWKVDGYYQRNRDLGQIFNLAPGQNISLDAIVLRMGNSASAVLSGTPGAGVFLQIFEVSGTPTINQNGTVYPAQSTHGFTTHASADDYLEGVTYTTVGLVTGGTFPNIPPTTLNGGQASHLSYMRWDLTGSDELTLLGGKRYAFMVGFSQPGLEQGFTLGNQNRVGSAALNTANPTLFKDANNTEWWSIRREGDGTLPPAMVPGTNPPSDPVLRQQLINESLFVSNPAAANYHYNLSPTTNGYPDVDTYRTFTFFMETKPAEGVQIVTATAAPSRVGWASRDTTVPALDTDPAQVRSDSGSLSNQRKAWVQFDLSDKGIDWDQVQSVTLTLTPSDQPSSAQSSNRELHVYGIGDGAWPAGEVTWANGPANDLTSAFAFLGASQIGLINIGGSNLEQTGVPLSITLDSAFFVADADKIITLGFSLGAGAEGEGSFKFYPQGGINAPSIAVQYVTIVPEPGAAFVGTSLLGLLLSRRRTR